MKKLLTDLHTHTAFSHDGRDDVKTMLETAYQKGLAFYGISEHFDYDYDESKMDAQTYAETRNVATEEYFHTARHFQEDYQGAMNVLVGAEFGYAKDEKAQGRYALTYEKYQPDYVINSLHSADGVDYYRVGKFQDKKQEYRQYLALVRASLDVPYPYDIVGHIGYVARYVPYANNEFDLEEFGAELDDIFQTIIRKDKILEINSSSKIAGQLTLPSLALVKRYYELGGRKISFGSDAHFKERIADKREEVIAALKEIGFSYLIVPCKGEHIKVEI